ncbi:uncharacterized protein [Drosophila takahashii]|uniref:uncharacterized protein n=1 Tax=Drosophila takahashii TaxID=29030 RepID=UPI001CF85685|nr:uncharacterized protein LOC108060347 [Drosophila takahashii]
MKEKKKSRRASSPDPEQAGPSNAVSMEDNYSDLEDQSHGEDEQEVPFILVDCTAFTVRSDLEAALSQVERERMEKLQADIESGNVPQLEDEEPPPELDMPINLSSLALAKLKDAEDERRFKEDLRNLRIAGVEEEEEEVLVPSISSTKSISEMSQSEIKRLLKTTANLEKICRKLEQIKTMQEDIMAVESVSEVTAATAVPERPGLRREGTFDIERDRDQNVDHPEIPIAPADSQTKKYMPETEQIISQIGDLLVKLQVQNEEREALDEGSSYSYMVTIKPAGGASNCSVHAITNFQSRGARRVVPTNNLRVSQASSINIFSPASVGGTEAPQFSMSSRCIDGGSYGPMSLPESCSSSRVKSPFLRRRPGSYLKVPAPARFCHGRKSRD